MELEDVKPDLITEVGDAVEKRRKKIDISRRRHTVAGLIALLVVILYYIWLFQHYGFDDRILFYDVLTSAFCIYVILFYPYESIHPEYPPSYTYSAGFGYVKPFSPDRVRARYAAWFILPIIILTAWFSADKYAVEKQNRLDQYQQMMHFSTPSPIHTPTPY